MAERSKILIVDDEPFNVDYLEQELEDLGYATISAANGQEALQKVATEAPERCVCKRCLVNWKHLLLTEAEPKSFCICFRLATNPYKPLLAPDLSSAYWSKHQTCLLESTVSIAREGRPVVRASPSCRAFPVGLLTIR